MTQDKPIFRCALLDGGSLVTIEHEVNGECEIRTADQGMW